jgi:hypothetical protein
MRMERLKQWLVTYKELSCDVCDELHVTTRWTLNPTCADEAGRTLSTTVHHLPDQDTISLIYATK